jgi:hypothetical protein
VVDQPRRGELVSPTAPVLFICRPDDEQRAAAERSLASDDRLHHPQHARCSSLHVVGAKPDDAAAVLRELRLERLGHPALERIERVQVEVQHHRCAAVLLGFFAGAAAGQRAHDGVASVLDGQSPHAEPKTLEKVHEPVADGMLVAGLRRDAHQRLRQLDQPLRAQQLARGGGHVMLAGRAVPALTDYQFARGVHQNHNARSHPCLPPIENFSTVIGYV